MRDGTISLSRAADFKAVRAAIFQANKVLVMVSPDYHYHVRALYVSITKTAALTLMHQIEQSGAQAPYQVANAPPGVCVLAPSPENKVGS